MSNKIGFNNFKAFGPKMQYFSKKPITLIYGPNSVGKSSLLHSQLYFEHIKQTKQNTSNDFYEDSFAGEELDLGGFKNFIYKHDINSELCYSQTITDKSKITSFLLTESSISSKDFSNITLSNIEEKLESSVFDSGIKFKYFLEMSIIKSRWIYNGLLEENDIIIKLGETEYINSKEKLYYNLYNEYKTIDKNKLIEIFDNTYKKLKKENSDLEQIIFMTHEVNSNAIYNTILFFIEIQKIETINYKIKTKLKDDELFRFLDFFVENEILFSYHFNDKKLSINSEHSLLKNASKLLTTKYEKYSSFYHDKEACNYYNFSLILILGKVLSKNQIQYYAPLRHYPKRYELFNVLKKSDLNTNQDKKPKISNFTLMLAKFLASFNKPIKKFKNKNFLYNFLAILLRLIQMVLMIMSIIFNKNYRQVLSGSDDIKDIWNTVLPDKFQLIRKNKLKSNEIWKKLSLSQGLVEKLNYWLGDNRKLKSNYKINILKDKIYINEIFSISFHKFFGMEKYLYTLEDKNNEQKLIEYPFLLTGKFFKFLDKKFNITNKFLYQVQFQDISKNTEVTPRDMGLGISQMLPILISTMNSKDTKIYLEQPELHLHPAVQMELMDEFIKSHNENNNEFMMESHSEHMLLRIMKRIRQTNDGTLEDESLKLTPDDVCLLYVDNDGEQTYIQELRLSKTGKLLDHWPNGFFEEGYKERFF